VGSPWKALADDSRRQMLLLLKDEEMTPSQIRTRFLLTLPAVSSHLRVLKDAGLVVERKQGKYRFYSVNFQTLSEAVGFFDGFLDRQLQPKGSKPRRNVRG
jgi:DNA-binding transcriptional ArsR family regulator